MLWVVPLSDWDLSTPALTAEYIRAHSEFVWIW